MGRKKKQRGILKNYLRNNADRSVVLSEFLGRISAVALLSLGAALDIAYHSAMAVLTCVYAIVVWDSLLPWQHVQRVRNAVAPLLLGSVTGLIHPYAGIAMSEPTDKHAVIGMIASNIHLNIDTPCSPIHSLSIIEDLASRHPDVFSEEDRRLINDARSYEETLENMQAQEYVQKIANISMYVTACIRSAAQYTKYEECVTRTIGLIVPILTIFDFAISTLLQAFLLLNGVVRCLTGRAVFYTEVTTNPLVHVAFFLQNILRLVGNILGSIVGLVSSEYGIRTSLFVPHLLFKAQMCFLMWQIERRMRNAADGSRFMIPIVFGNGSHSIFSLPWHTMHKTYLVVQKAGENVNLTWVNRPYIKSKDGMTIAEATAQIRLMLDERFPFMDTERVLHYPVSGHEPTFTGCHTLNGLANQGTGTNCVVSNLFGALEVLNNANSQQRYTRVRAALMRDYSFYRYDSHPQTFMDNIWVNAAAKPDAAI